MRWKQEKRLKGKRKTRKMMKTRSSQFPDARARGGALRDVIDCGSCIEHRQRDSGAARDHDARIQDHIGPRPNLTRLHASFRSVLQRPTSAPQGLSPPLHDGVLGIKVQTAPSEIFHGHVAKGEKCRLDHVANGPARKLGERKL